MNNIEFIIPEGYELDEKNSTDKKLVYKPKEDNIKDGELVYCEDSFHTDSFLTLYGGIFIPSVRRIGSKSRWDYSLYTTWFPTNVRRATPEEKRIFKDIMSENGWEYNEVSGTLTKKRWRAKTGDTYYVMDGTLFNVMPLEECDDNLDERHHKIGNYFKTKEEAEKYRQKIIDILTNR